MIWQRRPEYEANIVAAEILLDSDEILEYIYNYGYTSVADCAGNAHRHQLGCFENRASGRNRT